MNKIISSALTLFSIIVAILILISSLLTSERSLKFLLNLNQDSNLDLVLNDSHWHPYKPSIEIDTLSIKRVEPESKFIEIEGLKVKFNLLASLRGNLIESLYGKEMRLYVHPSTIEDQTNFNDLWLNLTSIKNLIIDEFSLMDSSNYSNTLKGELSLINLESGDSNVKFSAQNANGGDLDFRMHSISGSKSFKDYKGYVNTSNFGLNKEITSLLCSDCPTGILDGKIWFTLIDLRLVKFLGDVNFRFHSRLDLIESINAKIELEDTKNNIFRISSFVNGNPVNRTPVIFASLATKEVVFFIPEMELGKGNFINRFQHLLDLPKDLLLKGNIKNVILNLNDPFKLNAEFKEFSFESGEYSVAGLEGKLRHTKDVTRLNVNTPFLQIDLGSLFDSPLILNNVTSTIDLTLIDNKISISNSDLRAKHKKNLIKGAVNLFPSPYDETGDLSLKITSNKLDYLDALNLFPNLNYTKLTKSWLRNSITCGSLEEISFIYRGSIDNEYDDSSSSFQSKGLFNNSCLNINGVGIKNINLVLKINNSSFQGKFVDGNLYGSLIEGTIKTYKENSNYILDLEGNSKGPFSSILRLSNLNKIFDVEPDESGEHNTEFSFTSPLVSNLDLLRDDANLQIITKIKGANFKNKRTNLNFTNLFSSVEYDSSNGVKDGFATLKVNNIPIKFDIKKDKENSSLSTLLVAEEVFSAKQVLHTFDYKNEITGSSKFKILLTLPSYKKGQPFIDSKIEVLSNLEGISINFPEPFRKLEDSKIDFNLVFKPYFNKPPLLSFNYGDLFRGKFNFLNDLTEGFVIAGKKKQNISIAKKKILLVGELKKLDLGSFITYGIFNGKGSKNFFIKDLLVQETNLSNFSLLATRFSSYNTKEGVVYKFINDELNGKLLVPEKNDKSLSFSFDFIKISQPSSVSKDSFLSLYNSINQEFSLSADTIILNGHNYGNWEFSISPGTNQLTIYDIKGTYGRWDLNNNAEGISSLKISKNTIGWTSNLEANIYSGSPEKAFMQLGIEPNFELDTLSLDVDLTWNNLPWLFSYNSVSGEISANLNGLTIENNDSLESTNNLLRLVSIFNITDSLEKVTNLNFRKLYKRGFTVDNVKGKFKVSDKSLQIKEPILLKSGSSRFSWAGYISRDKGGNLDMLNLEVIMTLPLREYLPAYALVLGGPITAGVVYIAGKAFERNLDKISSGKWTINGHISEPVTEFEGWFEENNDK